MNLDALTAGDRTLFRAVPGLIDLGIGAPDLDLLDGAREALLAATRRCLQAPQSTTFLQYGPCAGDPVFRAALAGLLTERLPGPPAAAEQLFVTAGATSGLALAARCFFETGMTALIEDPTYFLARKVIEECGLRLDPVPQDGEGLRTDVLARKLAALPPAPDGRRFRAMLYLVPTFNNPTGGILSAARRQEIVALARRHEVLVVCDDVYDLLAFDDAPRPQRLVSMEGAEETVISNGSFSKILGPGVRCGWIEAHGRLHSDLARSAHARSGGAMSHLTAGALLELLASGDQGRLLDGLRETYRTRCAALCDALEEHLPEATIERPRGGFFVWVRLPPGAATRAALEACQAQGVRYQPGAWFGDSDDCLRLSFAHNPAEILREGARRLGAFWRLRLG
ncbi:MAG: 2-aminoadipate transaminase [Myxococcota bacterium]|jgi:2-aminoadipate transaminase